MPKKKIKRPKASASSDVRSDSGYLLPSQGLKRNGAAYTNRGKAIQKHQRQNRDWNNYQYTKQGRYS